MFRDFSFLNIPVLNVEEIPDKHIPIWHCFGWHHAGADYCMQYMGGQINKEQSVFFFRKSAIQKCGLGVRYQ